MRFITEEDLRDQYRKEPFTDYKVESGTRITPGARQFLMDRGIRLADEALPKHKVALPEAPISEAPAKEAEKSKPACSNRLLRKFKTMEALMLSAAEELLTRDILLSQRVISLRKYLSDLKGTVSVPDASCALCVQSCTGINADNFSEDLEDCFEITEFHIQLPKGKEIIVLHRLRCGMREIEAELEDCRDGACEDETCRTEALGKVRQIINTLSQWICLTVGGETCQKKS